MNLEELKRVVDFFYENANRYGRQDAGITQVGVILDGNREMVMFTNAMIDPSWDKYKLVFIPQSPIVTKPAEVEQEPLKGQPSIGKLTRELKAAEATVILLRNENKKLKSKLEKNVNKETGTIKTVTDLGREGMPEVSDQASQ